MASKRKDAEARALPVLAPDNLPYQLLLLSQSLMRRMQVTLNPFDLTPLHWGILCCLWKEDGLATQAFSTRLEQLGGTITVGLDAMEKRGLVERRSDEQDQRISRVYLTERGAALEEELVPEVEQLLGTIFSETSAADYKALARSVKRLRKHLAEL